MENLVPDRIYPLTPQEVIKEFNDLLKREDDGRHKSFQTVPLKDIGTRPDQNFQIVNIFEEEETVPCPESQEYLNQHNYKEYLCSTKYFKVKKSFAVLAYPASKAWEGLQNRVHELYDLSKKHEEQCKNLDKVAKRAEDEKAQATQSRDHYKQLYNNSCMAIDDEKKKNSRYEQDMVKLRRALGDLRMNEILDMKL